MEINTVKWRDRRRETGRTAHDNENLDREALLREIEAEVLKMRLTSERMKLLVEQLRQR